MIYDIYVMFHGSTCTGSLVRKAGTKVHVAPSRSAEVLPTSGASSERDWHHTRGRASSMFTVTRLCDTRLPSHLMYNIAWACSRVRNKLKCLAWEGSAILLGTRATAHPGMVSRDHVIATSAMWRSNYRPGWPIMTISDIRSKKGEHGLECCYRDS